ncbi:uncharacterized protein EV420DRAFT_156313 [Desarmillaria tabescens]|uniref:Uncharacterized protein n=1 Tax=Armillaria tabescens TaxID=1929756 RepID=A0AA39JAE7_ARMTA|nr:uncharacterized protein EV420DRAFT_156313 [Desarmillaria tabescens]KAK0437754.1 hypothetical protein EV420DRAFT_156313 [Desarmillaria tabescens]
MEPARILDSVTLKAPPSFRRHGLPLFLITMFPHSGNVRVLRKARDPCASKSSGHAMSHRCFSPSLCPAGRARLSVGIDDIPGHARICITGGSSIRDLCGDAASSSLYQQTLAFETERRYGLPFRWLFLSSFRRVITLPYSFDCTPRGIEHKVPEFARISVYINDALMPVLSALWHIGGAWHSLHGLGSNPSKRDHNMRLP